MHTLWLMTKVLHKYGLTKIVQAPQGFLTHMKRHVYYYQVSKNSLHNPDISRIMAKISSQLDTYTYNAILQHHRDTRHESPALHSEHKYVSATLHCTTFLSLRVKQAGCCILKVQHCIGVRAYLGCAPDDLQGWSMLRHCAHSEQRTLSCKL